MHVLVRGVVVEVEADLVAVELDGAADVGDGKDDNFEGPVHTANLGGVSAALNGWGSDVGAHQ